MAINLLHYSTGNDDPTWGVVRGNTVLPLPGQYATTADVLDQGADAARTLLAESGNPGIPLAGVTPLNPVAGARVVCQGANYQAISPNPALTRTGPITCCSPLELAKHY